MADARVAVLLDAAQYAADSDLEGLAELIALHQEWLRLAIVLRILLTYLPESTDPDVYLPLLRELSTWDSDSTKQTLGEGPPARGDLDPAPKLRLLPLAKADTLGQSDGDIFVSFLLDRAHRIDASTGSLTHIRALVEPFANRTEALQAWLVSIVSPLARLDYEFYPDLTPSYTLASFEKLQGRSGVYALLFELLRRNKELEGNYGRDFRCVLAPWIQGQARKMGQSVVSSTEATVGKEGLAESHDTLSALWGDVYGALLDHAVEHHASILSIVKDWDGPADIEWPQGESTNALLLDSTLATQKYIRMVLALLYIEGDNGERLNTEQESMLLQRAGALLGTEPLLDLQNIALDVSADSIPAKRFHTVTLIHIQHDELLDGANPLTEPSASTLQLGAFLAASAALMTNLQQPLSMHAALTLSVFGHAADQRTRMHNLLNGLVAQSSAGDGFWLDARKKLLWLRRWNCSTDDGTSDRMGLFGQIELREMEVSILKALTRAVRFKIIIELYINTERHLPRKAVEQILVESALSAYDNASNGNKDRGGMKKASDIITTFWRQFPESDKFPRVEALIQATHALSFYSLTLKHGTQFLPVNLRVYPDPLGLVDKVLEQNAQSYTKLRDLVEIGKNLVRAGLNLPQLQDLDRSTSREQALARVEKIVIAKAINASLSEGDFDTAYSYLVRELSGPTQGTDETSLSDVGDDVLWRAAYHAGRYQPPRSRDTTSELRRVEQRMELLSRAVSLAPADSLQEVLETWQSCEAEFNSSRVQFAQEEDEWNTRGDWTVPGGFTADSLPLPQKPRESTRRAMREEAPMGLFDVARGAAAAFSKSAFTPAQAQAGRDPGVPRPQPLDMDQDSATARVRKRDMVSNAVTGGLVSGIGWVLGANPSGER